MRHRNHAFIHYSNGSNNNILEVEHSFIHYSNDSNDNILEVEQAEEPKAH